MEVNLMMGTEKQSSTKVKFQVDFNEFTLPNISLELQRKLGTLDGSKKHIMSIEKVMENITIYLSSLKMCAKIQT